MSKSLILASCLLAAGGLTLASTAPASLAWGQGRAKSGAKVTGTITGTIKFSGKAPVRKMVDTSSDPVCGSGQEADKVVVTKGKLRDVHVRIKSGTAGTHKAPNASIVIDQVGCVYQPHVVGAMVGQPVAVRNSDKTMHNVHAYIANETWFNRSQPAGAPAIVERDTGVAGEVFELKCNVHPWMDSYVPLTDHPYFDVSDSKGSFSIKNVPAGTYTLEAWHPKLGLKSSRVTVGRKGAKVTFRYP
ncbi:MAG: TonB-dependent receptor [Myxococcales bacterium]|nr:TonB-dependent receptor [Myxococcales bacterium]